MQKRYCIGVIVPMQDFKSTHYYDGPRDVRHDIIHCIGVLCRYDDVLVSRSHISYAEKTKAVAFCVEVFFFMVRHI